MVFVLFGIFLCVVGVSLAIKLPLLIQAFIVIAGMCYMGSSYVRRKEILGVFDGLLVASLFLGLVIGDAIYYFSYRTPGEGIDITEGVKWLFTP